MPETEIKRIVERWFKTRRVIDKDSAVKLCGFVSNETRNYVLRNVTTSLVDASPSINEIQSKTTKH